MPLMVKILHESPYTHSRFKVWLLPHPCFKDQTNLISVLVNHLMLVYKKPLIFCKVAKIALRPQLTTLSTSKQRQD